MFKVPIIPPDLQHEETIIQVAYALDCLQKTILTIFEHIDKRIEKNNVKIGALQERINKSQVKINNLYGTRSAIHIYALPRFPSANIFGDLPVTFVEGNKQTLKQKIEWSKVPKYKIQNKMETNVGNIKEKLIFFHVREQNSENLMSENTLTKERCNIKQNQGLGNMPSDLRSIQSVLLFNRDYCVYEFDEYESETLCHWDAWRRAKLTKNRHQQCFYNQQPTTKKILEPAPHSLVNRRNEKLTPSGGLKYTPKLSEAPELDLPLDLPDLPGIADDLRYESHEAKQKIAPSLALVVENLPELAELIKDDDNIANGENEKQTASATIVTAAIPPPPPPPMPAAINSMQYATPPPPPPPPALLQQATIQSKSNIHNSENDVTTPCSDSRSELMAAIRNAGGIGKAHLRHTPTAPLTNNVVNNDIHNAHSNRDAAIAQNSSRNLRGGDLMADLHNKLLMRRKGISGSKDNTDSSNDKSLTRIPSGNPVISRLSSLIPPPHTATPKTNNGNSSNDDDENSSDTDWVD